MTVRDEAGRFIKGKSGNPRGRPKVDKEREAAAAQKMAEIYAEAKGNGVRVMELMLENGDVLGLSVAEGLRISRDLAPYQKAKLSSIDTTVNQTKEINIVFDKSLQHNPMKVIDDTTE